MTAGVNVCLYQHQRRRWGSKHSLWPLTLSPSTSQVQYFSAIFLKHFCQFLVFEFILYYKENLGKISIALGSVTVKTKHQFTLTCLLLPPYNRRELWSAGEFSSYHNQHWHYNTKVEEGETKEDNNRGSRQHQKRIRCYNLKCCLLEVINYMYFVLSFFVLINTKHYSNQFNNSLCSVFILQIKYS